MNEPSNNEQISITKYDLMFESRVTRLESAIINIDRSLSEIKMDIKDIRIEIKDIRKESKSDFRWTLTIIGALGAIMAHGFHWF